MKITITGSLGNISKPLAAQLIQQGHEVTIISSDEKKRTAIGDSGATAAIGSVTDVAFLTKAFAGADSVYAMIPPNLQSTDFRKYASGIGEQYVNAVRKAGVQRVVSLSSIGADQNEGTGPIMGNHDVETLWNNQEKVSVTHMRAGFFYRNFYGNMEMIRKMGIVGSNYPGDARIIMVSPKDIAAAVAEELQKPFAEKPVRYITSDERTAQETATVLGSSIGLPALSWVEFKDDQTKDALLQAGFSEEMAGRFVEMGQAVRSGKLWSDYDAVHAIPTGSIKLESFALEFKAAYARL